MRVLKILVTLRKYSSTGWYYYPLMLQMRCKDGTAEIFQSNDWLGQRKGISVSEYPAWAIQGFLLRRALTHQWEVQTFCISVK